MQHTPQTTGLTSATIGVRNAAGSVACPQGFGWPAVYQWAYQQAVARVAEHEAPLRALHAHLRSPGLN